MADDRTHRMIGVRMPVELYDAISNAARHEDRPLSSWVRAALRAYLADSDDSETPGSVGFPIAPSLNGKADHV